MLRIIKYRFNPVLFLLLLISVAVQGQTTRYTGSGGTISFTSDAPLEVIKAKSTSLRGVLDLQEQTFAFSLLVESFQGFNSPLQREHFLENYMESSKFPQATFTGRIIETLDLSKTGTIEIRAKGILHIHGVSRERIIRCVLQVEEGQIVTQSTFSVFLRDHDISIPRMVYQKIAEEIMVQVEITLMASQ